jgi:hypothetical protein
LKNVIAAEIDKGSYTNIALAERTLFKDVIEPYLQVITLKTRKHEGGYLSP